MLRRALILSAVAVYIIVVGCVLGGGKNSTTGGGRSAATGYAGSGEPLKGLPICSVTMQLQRMDWLDKYEKSIDEIAEIGADTVQFVVDPRQENGKSERIYLDLRMTPTPEQLGRLIKHAKDKGLRVTLMPIVLLDNPQGDEWRGKIHPASWSEWFDSYRNVMQHFAWIAEANHVDLLVVGSELVTTETPDHLDEWTRTIQMIRSTFHGKLTYSSNWDHYRSVLFWDQLDLIGMNSYWKLGKDRNATVSEIEENWRDIQVDLFKFQSEVKKPIMFLEIGWFSQANVAYEPWDYTKEEEPLDLDLQKRLYEGFFNVWWGEPRLGGFSVWEWPPDHSGTEDRGYTPHGKPAEKVLREYLSKPRWEVK